MPREVVLSKCSINAAGDLKLVLKEGEKAHTFKIPKRKTVDSIMMLLRELAIASEKPGPAFRTMLRPANLGTEATQPANVEGWIPTLCLQMDEEAMLRVMIHPSKLRPLAEALLALEGQFQKDFPAQGEPGPMLN